MLEVWKWGSNTCDTTVRGSGLFKYMRSQVAADGGCERDVVQKINDEGNSVGSAEKCAD